MRNIPPNTLPNPPSFLLRHFENVRRPYGAELSNVVEDIITMRHRNGEVVNENLPFGRRKVSA